MVAHLAAQEPAAKPKDPAAPAESRAVAKDRRMGLAKPIVMTKEREVYGAELTLKENTKLVDIMKDPKAYEGKKVRVSGIIGDVCQKKGCFMYLNEGDTKAQVKFIDYSFFVPLDAAGRTVTVEAVPQVTVHSEARRRHYAEDQGLPKSEIEKIKGDQTVVVLMAEAVEIREAASKADAAKSAESKPAAKKPE
jgi:hypothetical protein